MRSYTVGFVPPPQIWDLSELHQTALQVDDDHGAQHGLLKQRARDQLSEDRQHVRGTGRGTYLW